MSLRLRMLQVASLAPRLLADSTPLVESFVRSRLNPDGGFADRSGNSDLYYTLFGIECLRALKLDYPERDIAGYLAGFGDGEGLDLVHLGALIRCRANLSRQVVSPVSEQTFASRLEKFAARRGGYHARYGQDNGSAYACFMVYDAYQGLGIQPPELDGLCRCLLSARAADGSFGLETSTAAGTTPTTVAASLILAELEREGAEGAAAWICERAHPQGGFCAVRGAPLPDLLSTATALHALSAAHVDLAPYKESCLDFIDSLWTNQGSFHGTWEDELLDVEYTYYGLLALGHLAVA